MSAVPIYLAGGTLAWSYPEIASIVCMDHTSVMSAVNREEKRANERVKR
jgi:chromosomal replication initiation ATPase DnaA